MSTAEQWNLFGTEWKAALDEWGLKYFHMADFANRAKEYRLWSDDDRRFRFARLVGIINRHTLASIAIAVPVRSYNFIFTKQAKRFVGGPYGVAATYCFMDAAKVIHPLYPSAKIAYVFESGARGAGEILKVFQWNVGDPEQRERLKLLSLKFEGKDFIPLQAADILAYELYKHLPRQIGIDPRQPRVANLGMLSDCKLKSWGWLQDEELNKFATITAAAAEFHGEKRKHVKPVKRGLDDESRDEWT